jgi:hypothetical protein
VTAANRTSDSLSRYLPVAVAVIIIALGYVWFIQPRLSDYLRDRDEIASLENRVQSLQSTVDRGRSVKSPDVAATLHLYEERVSADDHVSDVVELLARQALDSAPAGRVKALQIATGTSATWAPGQAAAPSRTDAELADQPDPRFGLFPSSVIYTPVTVSFDSSYEAITSFAWRLRDMPTLVEIRAMELTRGLPLMHATFRLFVYQRGPAAPVAPRTSAPASGTETGTAPRVASLSVAGEW